jgi:multiple sugar transport system permease protein
MWLLLKRLARGSIAVIATLLIAGSFLWVGYRSLFRTDVRPDQIALRVVHWGDDDEDAIVEQLVREFEAVHPHIKVRRLNPGGAAAVNTKLQTMFASGDPPDVFQFGYEKVADWASKGLVMPLDELIEADLRENVPDAIRLDDYYTSVMDCYRFADGQLGQGPLYGIAKDFTTVGFYYNRDLYRRAGLPDPRPDWTWDDFIADCRALARLPGVYGAEFVTWEAQVRLFVWTHGTEFADNAFENFNLRDPALEAALSKLRGWFHDPAEVRTFFSAKTQLETGEDLFLSGRVGLSGPLGRWKVPTFRLIKGFDWDFAPLPRGSHSANALFTSAWAIARDAKYPKEAWELVRFLCGRRGQELACAPGLAIPTHKQVAQGPIFVDPSKKPDNDQAFLDMIPVARPINWPSDPRYLSSLRTTLETLLKTGRVSAREALDRVERDWEAIRADQPERTPIRWPLLLAAFLGPVALAALFAAAWWWRNRPGRHALREELAGYGMISPWVIGFAAFTAMPILVSLLLAFCEWDGMSSIATAKWTGLANIRAMFRDPTFHKSLTVTALYALFAVPLGQLAALGAALLMNHELRGIGFFRSAWYLPSVLAGVGIAILWKWVFDDENGLLNDALAALTRGLQSVLGTGLVGDYQPRGWLEKDANEYAVPAFVIISLWSIGGSMMIYLAGLKGIPQDLYEAASIDGAVAWRRFVNVTLPMLSPVIFFNVIIAIIASFQLFTQAYVMTGGGPGDATRFYVMYLYNAAFDNHQMGFASAMAWLLLLIVLALTLLTMWGSRRFVYYEALRN